MGCAPYWSGTAPRHADCHGIEAQFTPGLRDRGAGSHKELPAMEFRWVAIIALWTILSGPVFAPPAPSRARGMTAASARKATGQKPTSPDRNPTRPDRR